MRRIVLFSFIYVCCITGSSALKRSDLRKGFVDILVKRLQDQNVSRFEFSIMSFMIPWCLQNPGEHALNDVPLKDDYPKTELSQILNPRGNHPCYVCNESCKTGNHTRHNACASVVLLERDTEAAEIHVRFNAGLLEMVRSEIEFICPRTFNCSHIKKDNNCSHNEHHNHPPRSLWDLVENIMLLLSLLSLLFTIFIHLALPEMRNLHGKNISCFSAALLISQLLLLHDFSVETRIHCTILAVVTHYFWLVVFMWTSVLAYDLARTFNVHRLTQRRVADDTRRFAMYCLVGWGIPLVLVSTTSIVLKEVYDIAIAFGKPPKCFQNFNIALYTVGIPIYISMVFNIFCFGIVIHGIEAHKRKSLIGPMRRNGKKGERFKCIFYGKISVLCGMFWILYVMIHVFGDAIRIYSTMLMNFQGILIFLTTVLFNRRARGAVKRQMSEENLSNRTNLSTIS